LTAGSILPDLPTTFYTRDDNGGNVPYQPLNYDRLFHGPVSVRTALASSYNIPAVRTLDYVGVDTLRKLAAQAGISSFTEEAGLALTLGGGEVKLLDLTTAYAIFLNGQRLDTRTVLDIQRRDAAGEWQSLLGKAATKPGEDVETRTTRHGTQVISPEAAYLITDILSDNAARIPGFGENSVLELPFSAAVKTGTTTDWRDNWTIGYSTERIVGVWVGNADNTPMLDVSGIDGAGPIWHDLMLAAHTTPPAPFTRPPAIVEIPICAPSGLLPSPTCQRIRNERYIKGTVPTVTDNQFIALTVDSATGHIATDATPVARRQERVYWRLPPEYYAWMVSQGIPLPPPTSDMSVNGPSPTASSQSNGDGPLLLAAPTSNTAYRIHPGVPRDRQKIEVTGYTSDGTSWRVLRLMVDGTLLAEAQHANRLHAWWEFAPGNHSFWLEGQRTTDGPIERSAAAMVMVDGGNESTMSQVSVP
jgi:membrane carboxypeptidase/penicillin-binding protein PbpC